MKFLFIIAAYLFGIATGILCGTHLTLHILDREMKKAGLHLSPTQKEEPGR